MGLDKWNDAVYGKLIRFLRVIDSFTQPIHSKHGFAQTIHSKTLIQSGPKTP